MRRVFTWGLPLYAAVMTGIFVGKGVPDNNLRAEEDARTTAIKAAAPALANVPPPPATGNSYPIPAPVAQPKHLFHFVIRYEGDGMPDPTMLATAVAAAGDIPITVPKKSGKPNVVKVKAPDLFQFIIRYEGDGIVDDNVAKVLKDYFTAALSEKAPPPVRESRSTGNSTQYGAIGTSPGTLNPTPTTFGPLGAQVGPASVAPTPVRRAPEPAPRNSAPATRAPAPTSLPAADE